MALKFCVSFLIQVIIAVMVVLSSGSNVFAGCAPPTSEAEEAFLAEADLIAYGEVIDVNVGKMGGRVGITVDIVDVYQADGSAPDTVETLVSRALVSVEYTSQPPLSKGHFLKTGEQLVFFFKRSDKNIWDRFLGRPDWTYLGPGFCPEVSREKLQDLREGES